MNTINMEDLYIADKATRKEECCCCGLKKGMQVYAVSVVIFCVAVVLHDMAYLIAGTSFRQSLVYCFLHVPLYLAGYLMLKFVTTGQKK